VDAEPSINELNESKGLFKALEDYKIKVSKDNPVFLVSCA
jgi:hypothetical protein